MTTKKRKIKGLRKFPNNPNIGDVEEITKSLETMGQYRPIVVWKRNSQVLVGNHVLEAAKRLGWEEVDCLVVDVDEATAKRIVLMDNKSAEVGGYDSSALMNILSEVVELEGTGYTEVDLDQFVAVDETRDLFRGEAEKNTQTGEKAGGTLVEVGPYSVRVVPESFREWKEGLEEELGNPKRKEVTSYLITSRLGLKEQVKEEAVKTERKWEKGEARILGDQEQVAVASLNLFPGNPRKGDVELIAESLCQIGQYRPIVVRKEGKVVLAGNHTLIAARKLGWETIGVVWVEGVSVEEARRIVLADNRLRDLSVTDDELLADLLSSLDDGLVATGYTEGDLEILLNSIRSGKGEASDMVIPPRIKIGPYSGAVTADSFSLWESDLEKKVGGVGNAKIMRVVLKLLGISVDSVSKWS